MWVLLSCLIYLYFFQTIPTSKQTGSTVTHLEKVSLFAPVSLLFLKSMTYTPLPLDTNFSCQLPTTFMEPHSIDTFWDSSSSPLQWYLIQEGCSLLPEALLSLDSWKPTLTWYSPTSLAIPSHIPLLVVLLLTYRYQRLRSSLGPVLISLFSLPQKVSSTQVALNITYTLKTLKCVSLASDFFSEIQASIFIAYLSQI